MENYVALTQRTLEAWLNYIWISSWFKPNFEHGQIRPPARSKKSPLHGRVLNEQLEIFVSAIKSNLKHIRYVNRK